jgi:hypothetical protein
MGNTCTTVNPKKTRFKIIYVVIRCWELKLEVCERRKRKFKFNMIFFTRLEKLPIGSIIVGVGADMKYDGIFYVFAVFGMSISIYLLNTG